MSRSLQAATVTGVPEPLPTVTLTGRHVRLEPLSIDHAEALAAAAAVDRSTFDLSPVPDGLDATRAYIDALLEGHARGVVLPFAQRQLDTGDVVGCTRYLDLQWWRGRAEPDEVEIGGTWLGAAAQRTAINTEAKYLLLGYAFEELDVWRVAICTDARNQRSRDAIMRIGASFEGLLRNHRVRSDADSPSPRQTALYSIVDDEWPDVKRALEQRLAAR
jgi:RimJ/RimL family protein N-acetyltransferase